jgi:hypothetical protein
MWAGSRNDAARCDETIERSVYGTGWAHVIVLGSEKERLGQSRRQAVP